MQAEPNPLRRSASHNPVIPTSWIVLALISAKRCSRDALVVETPILHLSQMTEFFVKNFTT
jgi:hypothetical protein